MSSSVAPSGKCGHGQLRRRPGPAKRPCRVSVALVAGIATAFSLGAQPIGGAAASAQLLAASNPAAASSGCPTAISVDLGAGQQCVGWRVSMFLQSESSNGVCDDALFMLVPLSEHADEYLALWNRTGPNADPSPSAPWAFTSATGGPFGGEQAWSTTALTPQNTGVGVHFDVPKGDGAWFVSAGGGRCDLLPSAGDIEGVARAWAVTYKRELSGQVTYAESGMPVPGLTIEADCPSGGATATGSDGKYQFLLDKGPCTITPEPPDGEGVSPEKQALDVEGNIDHVDFQVTATLYFKVGQGLSVKSDSGTGAGLVKAGSAFTEQVTLKDISKTKTVVVAPIYPTLSGNANGGALQPVGGVVQRQLASLSTANPSPIVVLAPGQEQVFDSVIYTDASRILGTDDGGKKVSGGTRATVRFSVPNAFTLEAGNNLKPLDPRQIVVAKDSTDPIAVGIDDSAPDQMPLNAYVATWDISKGLVLGLYHFTVGLVQGVCVALQALGSAVVNIPTAVINYVDAEAQLWQEVRDDPVESALFLNIVTNNMLLVYKQAPFLLKRLGDLKAAVDAAVYQHFDKIEQDWSRGDWEAAVTAWADDGANLSANLLILNPSLMAGAIGDATLARIPGVIEDLDAAEATQFAKNDEVVDEALGTGESEGEIGEAEAADEALAPGNILTPDQMANIFGVSPAEFASMADTARGEGVLITLRPRATEAISLIEKGLSYVKPAAIKLKTVSAMDIRYLGYPADVALDGQEVSAIGQVIIKQPLFLSEVCLEQCALAKFRADVLSLGLTTDSPEYLEVQNRWLQRYGEWTDEQAGYVGNLQSAAKNHYLTLDWHWGENHIYPDMVQSAQKVGFRLATGPAGTSIPEVRLPGQGWRSITGDIDLVSITNTDNSALSDEQYVKVLEEMGAGPVQTQHPATATWYNQVNDDTFLFDPNDPNFADKAKYMQADKCCLMQVGPDGKARAVKFQLDGSQFVDQNNYYINYVGGYRAPAPGVLGAAQ